MLPGPVAAADCGQLMEPIISDRKLAVEENERSLVLSGPIGPHPTLAPVPSDAITLRPTGRNPGPGGRGVRTL